MSTMGLVLITGIGDVNGSNNIIGILFGLGAAVFYASVILLNKFIKNVEGIHRTFLQFIAAIIVLIPYVLIRNKLSDANDVITIRPFTQKDIEYVISRHKTLYYAERHLSGTFSAYVDKIVYDFATNFDPETDCLNILECNGVPAGSIAIAKVDETTAQLRFFMLEPEMRQRGYGNRLMDMALQFCRDKGYKKVFLLTITAQVIARHVYETHGFYKVSSNDKSEWGDGVVEERWDVDL